MPGLSIFSFLRSQYFVSLPYPKDRFDNKTIIVTGSNVGLGKEAALHFARLGASSVILAVRSTEKGNAAKADIERTTGCSKNVIKVWQLDMSSYASVQDFATRAERELPRLDIALLNAGIAGGEWRMNEKDEATITVNVVSTFLLALLLLPKLKETAKKYNTRPNLTITSSEVHFFAKFEERKAPEGGIFERLSADPKTDMAERYQVSKLLEVYCIRAMAERTPADKYPVTINCLNPGLCHSELARDAGLGLMLIKIILARSTEKGSRTLVHAASQGSETHGEYLSDCKVHEAAPIVTSEEGHVLQERVWDELSKKLEAIRPGVIANL
ncbi:short-chain dehydrogenase [Lindgomyces ingoldianus]|uniref:Short-chain dehydrogenase n=1 Tax=Lindgomyces ingoldianus TaxID=673940 RepID=A0ACB6QFV3_9PLEO|nr:short-chain dehydrogenase [Lindgomyces ingoldianus]KAF2464992.1 short-chain dehydrogenase [Lindgomyces ingoldianus]